MAVQAGDSVQKKMSSHNLGDWFRKSRRLDQKIRPKKAARGENGHLRRFNLESLGLEDETRDGYESNGEFGTTTLNTPKVPRHRVACGIHQAERAGHTKPPVCTMISRTKQRGRDQIQKLAGGLKRDSFIVT